MGIIDVCVIIWKGEMQNILISESLFLRMCCYFCFTLFTSSLFLFIYFSFTVIILFIYFWVKAIKINICWSPVNIITL